jgi:ATP-binding cassette subfamily B protein RaxB
LTVQGLHFRHAAAGPELLAGVSFELAPGELVALVGPAGSGKTSLLKLMLGQLQPDAGALRLDGMTPAERGSRRWGRAVRAVMHDEAAYAGSIADSIGFLAPRPDRRRIVECARCALVHAEIEALPAGYATEMAEVDGAAWSGLLPRILLARALYARPQVLLWDEATGALRADEARLLWQALERLPQTRLVVTHRPEWIARADRVIALGEGRILRDLRRAG